MAYYDNYLQGFIELIRVKKILLDASLKSTDKSAQYNRICFGLTILSEIIIEKYIGYFPHNSLESFKMIAKAFLNDPSLQPEKTSQFKQVLISLKHTAMAILWQIQEYENQETKPLNWTDFYTSNKSVNQCVIDDLAVLIGNFRCFPWGQCAVCPQSRYLPQHSIAP
jgi:hypothetical protein